MMLLFKRISYVVPLYFCIRVIFYFYNKDIFLESSSSEVILSLLYGLRFDLAGIVLLNLPFIISSLLLVNFQRFNKLLFVLLNFIGLAFLIVDVEFFQFLGKKMTFDIFDLGDDIAGQSSQLVFYYWKLFLLYIVGAVYIIKFYPYSNRNKKSIRDILSIKHIAASFLVLGLSFVAIRGGLQSRSIGPKEAFIFSNHTVGNLALNPVYTIIRSSLKESDERVKLYKTDLEAIEVLEKKLSFSTQNFTHPQKQNVVILILESFSYEYMEQGYTPYLSSLKDSSLFYKGYANGRRSIEALPSILLGLPSIASVPISQSAYQGNKFYSFPKYLKGYDYSFYHGGKNGTMGFDSFSKAIGFHDYFGLNEYPNKEHFDGAWGISDHHYLDYYRSELSKKKKPFVSALFTLSSHQPYIVPDEFKGKFPKGNLEVHETIGYTDNSIKVFFEKAKDEPWFENTLFVITADHTQKLETNKYNTELGRYSVPIIFYHPKINLNTHKKDRTVSHTDILPSVLDFLNVKHSPKILLGSSVFSNEVGVMFNKTASDFLVLEKDENIKNALTQYFINGLIKNNIYRQ